MIKAILVAGFFVGLIIWAYREYTKAGHAGGAAGGLILADFLFTPVVLIGLLLAYNYEFMLLVIKAGVLPAIALVIGWCSTAVLLVAFRIRASQQLKARREALKP